MFDVRMIYELNEHKTQNIKNSSWNFLILHWHNTIQISDNLRDSISKTSPKTEERNAMFEERKKGNCHKIDVVRQMLRSKAPLELPLHKYLSFSEFLLFQRHHESSPTNNRIPTQSLNLMIWNHGASAKALPSMHNWF